MAQDKEVSVEDFTQAISLLIRRIRSDAPPELRDFSWTQKNVLSRLEKDGPATAAALARAEGITPQSLGSVIKFLEESGLVERKEHPTDGRQMLIKLSVKGVALRKRTKEARDTWLSDQISKLNKQEQAILSKASEIIKKMIDQP